MSLYAGRKPELTDERREKIVAWYEENVASMMAELEAWYPDKLVYPKSVKVHHGSFVDRASAVANELGYEGWPRLASAYGFDAGIGLVTKIDIGSDVDLIADRVWKRIADFYLPSIGEWYPDGIVSDFRKSHPKTAENLVKLAKKFGYESWAELLAACGYDVRDSDSRLSYRGVSDDPDAVFVEQISALGTSSGRLASEKAKSSRDIVAAEYEALRRSCGLEPWPEISALPPCENLVDSGYTFISFEGYFVPLDAIECAALRRGNVLELRASANGSVLACFCNKTLGLVKFTDTSSRCNPATLLPSPQPLSNRALAIDKADSFSYTNPETGAKTSYEFLFAGDGSDEDEVYYFGDSGLRSLRAKCSAGASPERRIRKSYFTDWLREGDGGMSLTEMVGSYKSHSGVGTPLAVVAGLDYEPMRKGVLDVVIQVRMAFDTGRA